MSVKFVIVVLALVVSVAFATPAQRSNYIEQEHSCREVCGLCDCDGFYCEDECICECNLEEDENLQCIADMKKECDANGLEYEVLMQESAKERFLREISGNSLDFNKHLVILKQKRQSAAATAEPVVAAPAPSATTDSVVGAPATSATPAEPTLGDPFAAITAFGGKAAIAGKTAFAGLTAPKILVMLKERLERGRSPATTRKPIVLPTWPTPSVAPTTRPRPSLPSLLPVQPKNLFGL